MIQIRNFPKGPAVWLAVSGGIDSMTILELVTIQYSQGKKRISGVININHGTPHGAHSSAQVAEVCARKGVPLHQFSVPCANEQGWRDARKTIFRRYEAVVTAHHLDDVVEWWLLTSLHGKPRLIPWRSGNVHHPFLLTTKSSIEKWSLVHQVNWVQDPSNQEGANDRAKLRRLMPGLLDIYPGIQKTIAKKITTTKEYHV